MIDEWKSLFTQEIALDARFHPRLIGAKGRTIRKVCIQERFVKSELEFGAYRYIFGLNS